jgi:hypothetical protein
MEQPETAPIVRVSLAARGRRELIQYLAISAYLYVCFGALIFYKESILQSEGIAFAAYGLAFGKALILGKFILMAHALSVGDRIKPRRLVVVILWKSVLFALLLILLSLVEEVLVGVFRGRHAEESLEGVAGGTLPQVLATSLLILLIMIPYFTFREVSVRMGKGRMLELMTELRASQGIGN